MNLYIKLGRADTLIILILPVPKHTFSIHLNLVSVIRIFQFSSCRSSVYFFIYSWLFHVFVVIKMVFLSPNSIFYAVLTSNSCFSLESNCHLYINLVPCKLLWSFNCSSVLVDLGGFLFWQSCHLLTKAVLFLPPYLYTFYFLSLTDWIIWISCMMLNWSGKEGYSCLAPNLVRKNLVSHHCFWCLL